MNVNLHACHRSACIPQMEAEIEELLSKQAVALKHEEQTTLRRFKSRLAEVWIHCGLCVARWHVADDVCLPCVMVWLVWLVICFHSCRTFWERIHSTTYFISGCIQSDNSHSVTFSNLFACLPTRRCR